MENTQQRLDSIEGLLLGVAIGDALGLAREGLSRRTALRKFGRPPLKYQLWPGVGLYSDDTQLMLMAAQAIVNSRSQSEDFIRSYRRRLSWYAISMPAGVGGATWISGLLSWLSFCGIRGGWWSAGNGASTRSMLIALALHNTGHRTWKWVQDSARITHIHPHAVDGCVILATLAEIAATNRPGRLNAQAALKRLIQTCQIIVLRDRLEAIVPFLEQERSPSSVARHFGWKRGISSHIVPTVVMATYCWLRFPLDYRRCVESAITLGGDSDSLGAIVGGLAGSHLGKSALPAELVQQLDDWPHDRQWIHNMALRLTDWPHGVDDLLVAPSLQSSPFSQLIRSLTRWPLMFLHILMRIPCWLRGLLG